MKIDFRFFAYENCNIGVVIADVLAMVVSVEDSLAMNLPTAIDTSLVFYI